VFTVDLLGGRNMEQFTRVFARNRDQCGACHHDGQEGVEAVLGILRRERQLIMRQAGTVTASGISTSHLVDASLVP
jgi:isopentenyl diphosphate isomerase/L-lactate dehydrogenase-like FMN-dependent dehydrogenase